MTLPNSSDPIYGALGNWSINTVVTPGPLGELLLNENTTSGDVGLSYVVGNADRLLGGKIVTAHIVSTNSNSNYFTDKNGLLSLEVCFDPRLPGHTFVIGAYANDVNRTGIASKEVFRWNNFTTSKAIVDNNGSSYDVNIFLGIGGTISEPLIDVNIAPESIVINSTRCKVDPILSNYHTDGNGNIRVHLVTDGVKDPLLIPPGVDTCSVSWDAKANNILKEY